MADNITIKDSTGSDKVVATKDLAGVHIFKRMSVDSSGTEVLPATSGKQDTIIADLATLISMARSLATISATVTRPADTNAYAANDCWSTSTSAPTVAGDRIIEREERRWGLAPSWRVPNTRR